MLATLIGLLSYQQRLALPFVYAFKGSEGSIDDKFFSLSASYPELDATYGLVSGLVYNLPYVFFGLLAGSLVDNVQDPKNRAKLFSLVSIAWSLTSIASGTIDSFGAFVSMRFLMGTFNAFENPLGYALI